MSKRSTRQSTLKDTNAAKLELAQGTYRCTAKTYQYPRHGRFHVRRQGRQPQSSTENTIIQLTSETVSVRSWLTSSSTDWEIDSRRVKVVKTDEKSFDFNRPPQEFPMASDARYLCSTGQNPSASKVASQDQIHGGKGSRPTAPGSRQRRESTKIPEGSRSGTSTGSNTTTTTVTAST